VDSSLLGAWVQSDYSSGSRKTWEFGEDGSYRFMLVAVGQVVEQEEGTFTSEGATLALTPTNGPERSLDWIIDKDPYVGDTRLVLGGSDIYYRQ
jgi:hypothetical protein